MGVLIKQFFLAFQLGAVHKTVYKLLGPTTIGRDPDNTITVINSTVSRHHAKVSLQDGKWTVEDLGSANGIIVNGQRGEKFVLKPDDTFQLGEITFTFIEKESIESKDERIETIEILSTSITMDSDTLMYDAGLSFGDMEICSLSDKNFWISFILL